MPIINPHFENNIFFAQEVGSIDRVDAEHWCELLRYYTSTNPTPIVALVDALEVVHISAAARELFAKASHTRNLRAVVVAAQAAALATSSMIGMMGERDRTHVFYTLDEARKFAKEALLQPSL